VQMNEYSLQDITKNNLTVIRQKYFRN